MTPEELIEEIRYYVKSSLHFQKSKDLLALKRILDDYDERVKEGA